MSIPGAKPSNPSELSRVEDRVSFVYLERAVIAREANALTATGENGVYHIPSAALLVLLLGPGTNVTHQAMTVLADSGASIVWVGEQGVRYYAGGRPLGRSTRLLVRQAEIVSNVQKRMRVARRMYEMRFPNEDTRGSSMQQLRGKEGARVRSIYREWSQRTGVKWQKRDYDIEDFDNSDEINQALSAANSCLYGVAHAAVVALGCSPGLGVVHTGHDRSFIYDIADLYKAETSIPVAFETVAAFRDASELSDDLADSIDREVRRRMRERFMQLQLIERMVSDVKLLLLETHEPELRDTGIDFHGGGHNALWDSGGEIPGGRNHGREDEQA